MLEKKWQKENIKRLGFKNLKEFQKWVGIKADGIYGNISDKWLSKVSVYAKKQLSRQKKVTAKMDNNPKMGLGTVRAIKQYEKACGEKKAEGTINKAQRISLGLEDILLSKAVFKWQNREGNIVWNKVPYFKQKEFICGCGKKYCAGYNGKKVNPYLLNMLINIRKKYGAVQITSGIRCQKYNDSLAGSSKNSKHILGKAVDIYVKGASKSDVMNYAKKQKNYNYTYSNDSNMGKSVHVDVK